MWSTPRTPPGAIPNRPSKSITTAQRGVALLDDELSGPEWMVMLQWPAEERAERGTLAAESLAERPGPAADQAALPGELLAGGRHDGASRIRIGRQCGEQRVHAEEGEPPACVRVAWVGCRDPERGDAVEVKDLLDEGHRLWHAVALPFGIVRRQLETVDESGPARVAGAAG